MAKGKLVLGPDVKHCRPPGLEPGEQLPARDGLQAVATGEIVPHHAIDVS
jgi:hypothetical protein